MKRLKLLKICACNKINFSSNINEVIRAVLNFLFFFYKKVLLAQKAPKAQKPKQAKVQNTNKRTKVKNFLKKHLRRKK